MPGKAEEQKRIGISIQNSIKPTPIGAFLKFKPGNLPVATVNNGCELGKYPSQQKCYIPPRSKKHGGKDAKQERYK